MAKGLSREGLRGVRWLRSPWRERDFAFWLCALVFVASLVWLNYGGPSWLEYVAAGTFGVVGSLLLLASLVFEWLERWEPLHVHILFGIGSAITIVGCVGVFVFNGPKWFEYLALGPLMTVLALLFPSMIGGFCIVASTIGAHHVKWCREHKLSPLFALFQVFLYFGAGTLVFAFMMQGADAESGDFVTWTRALNTTSMMTTIPLGGAIWGWLDAMFWSANESDLAL